LDAPVERWDEGIPLGNGLIGGLLWGKGNEIRLSLDRGDLWDLRRYPVYARADFTYQTVLKYAKSGNTDKLSQEFGEPSEFPTKLPGARLVVKLSGSLQARAYELDLGRATGLVDFGGGKRAESLVSESAQAALLHVPEASASFDLVANTAVRKLGYEPAEVKRGADSVTLVQKAAEGFRYVIHAGARRTGSATLIAVAITTNRESDDPGALAAKRVENTLARGFVAARAAHEKWWARFWSVSSISIPDARVLQHYNLAQYYYGAASRRGAPPMPLQGLWTADAGTLPPWRGDYHHDLNTQLTYWAYLASGHFEEGLAFLDFLWKLKPRHEQFAREFYGLKQGMVVPGVMALDGSAMGSWFQYTLSPTMSAWLAQSFYLHWRYTNDRKFLAERA
jgi:alpha-L-fucosidase 2